LICSELHSCGTHKIANGNRVILQNKRVLLQEGGTQCRAEVVGPDNDREHAFPERELEKSDREQPAHDPKPSRTTVFDFYLHSTSIYEEEKMSGASHAKQNRPEGDRGGESGELRQHYFQGIIGDNGSLSGFEHEVSLRCHMRDLHDGCKTDMLVNQRNHALFLAAALFSGNFIFAMYFLRTSCVVSEN